MKAPDKIYINSELDCLWTVVGVTGDVEYINKKALLEWLEDMEGTYAEPDIYETYQTVIAKLNSM